MAACLVQRRAGGDLARLLRDCARAFEDQPRLADEVRAATAQARFTGLLVVVLPLGGALLAELASPGFLAGLAGSPLTAWLVGLALVLQVAAAVLIRRLGRVQAGDRRPALALRRRRRAGALRGLGRCWQRPSPAALAPGRRLVRALAGRRLGRRAARRLRAPATSSAGSPRRGGRAGSARAS